MVEENAFHSCASTAKLHGTDLLVVFNVEVVQENLHHVAAASGVIASGDLGFKSIADFGRTSTIEAVMTCLLLHIGCNAYVPDSSTGSHT